MHVYADTSRANIRYSMVEYVLIRPHRSVMYERMKQMGTLRNATTGQYVAHPRCDACAQPIAGDYLSDDEVCGDDDGPGFFLCARKRCVTKRDALDVEARRALYTKGRAAAEARS